MFYFFEKFGFFCMNNTKADLNQYFAHYRIGNQNFKLKISPLASKFTKNKSIKIRSEISHFSKAKFDFFQERYIHSWMPTDQLTR